MAFKIIKDDKKVSNIKYEVSGVNYPFPKSLKRAFKKGLAFKLDNIK